MLSARTTITRRQGPVVLGLAVLACLILGTRTARAAERPSDETVTHWVENAIREDPRVPSERVTVNTVDGIVTLDGKVRTLAAVDYAVLETKKIKGVRGVIDELKVDTPDRFNCDIAQDILDRLLDSSSIVSRNIGVDVDDGAVTLTGEVSSWAEAEQARLLARETSGVRSVVNHLTVKGTEKRPDSEILDDIQAALHRDIHLTDLPITVTVKDGTVTFTGNVGTAYEKDCATTDALLVRNVKQVKNDLEIKWWDEMGTRARPPMPTNAKLEAAVHDEIYEDLRIDPFGVSVEANGGHVTLHGMVPTLPQKRIAEKDARDVVGTAWVTNLLSVDADRRSDESILEDVRFGLASDSTLCTDDIHASVADGTVNLTGEVNRFWEKSHAQDVVARVKGARDVVNDIKVNYQSPYSDASIRIRVEERLRSNAVTFPVADAINVEVHGGRVTLSGTVDLWSQYSDAELLAFNTDGAWAVINQLKVRDVDYEWADFVYPWPLTHLRDTVYPPFAYFYLWG
jgi:osmotically-inducible protein OsmY